MLGPVLDSRDSYKRKMQLLTADLGAEAMGQITRGEGSVRLGAVGAQAGGAAAPASPGDCTPVESWRTKVLAAT